MVYRKLAFILVFLSFGVSSIPAGASLSNVYLALTAQGGNTGVNCANALAGTFFNSAGNWGSGASQIGPGTTVHVCGVWTGAANVEFLKFQGSGTAGNVITLLFEPGAILQAPYFSTTGAAIVLNGKSHLLIDGGATCGVVNRVAVPLASCNGIIRTTANGTNLTYQNKSYGIIQTGNPTNIEIRNLVTSMYKRVDPHTQSNSPDGIDTIGIRFDHSGATNVRIHHNNVQHDRTGIWLNFESASPDNWQIYNNYVADNAWGIALTGYGTNTFATNLQLHDNEITEWTNWVTPQANFHANGFFIYNNCPKTTPEVQDCIAGDANSNIYNNYIHGDLKGGYVSASPSGFIHAPARSNFNIFNNLLVAFPPADYAAGAVYTLGCIAWPEGQPKSCGGGIRVFNNTFSVNGGFCAMTDILIPNIYKNNIFTGGCMGIGMYYSGYDKVISDYNDVYLTGNRWVCENNFQGQFCKTLAQIQVSPYFQDAHSVGGNPLLNSNFRPQAGSAAIGTGVNLTSLGIAALNFDANGVARPATGPWDMGALQSIPTEETIPPAAPTNLGVQ